MMTDWDNAKSTITYELEGLDYRGRRKYGRIHFGTRHHFVPHKMVEVTGDTDGTLEFECAILNAGRPGAVKCSTQCRHCEVTGEERSTGRLPINDDDNGVDDNATQESKLEKRLRRPFPGVLVFDFWRVPTPGGKTIPDNQTPRVRMRITPTEVFCGTFVTVYTVLSYWTSRRKPRKENQPS
jgi:hypothetical protein